jgi:hypothetical protein
MNSSCILWSVLPIWCIFYLQRLVTCMAISNETRCTATEAPFQSNSEFLSLITNPTWSSRPSCLNIDVRDMSNLWFRHSIDAWKDKEIIFPTQSVSWSIKIEVTHNSQNKIDLQNLPGVVTPILGRYGPCIKFYSYRGIVPWVLWATSYSPKFWIRPIPFNSKWLENHTPCSNKHSTFTYSIKSWVTVSNRYYLSNIGLYCDPIFYMAYLLSPTSGDVYDYIQPKPLHRNWSSIPIKFEILEFDYKSNSESRITSPQHWHTRHVQSLI